jgi:hypothetical protein
MIAILSASSWMEGSVLRDVVSARGTVRGLTATANWSIDAERSLSLKRLPEAQFQAKRPFVFYYLMRNYWEGFGF